MKQIRILSLFWCLASSTSLNAQDSLQVFRYDQFIQTVLDHHPISFQAELDQQQGEAYLLKAKGAFDPKLGADVAQKYFEGKKYYGLHSGMLKIPTWTGIDIETSFEQNEGVFLNGADNTPTAGLWAAGISLPLGRGLFIDERRAMIKQARLFVQQSILERTLTLNELIYEAGKSYWYWLEAYYIRQVYLEAYTVAQERADAISQGALLGDRPFIDTVEANIQVQNRQVNLQQATLNYQNSVAHFNTYLWADGFVPLELAATAIPDILEDQNATPVDLELEAQLVQLLDRHPMLLQNQYKIQSLEVEKKLKREFLKPTVDLKYNALMASTNENLINNFSLNDYKWGVTFSLPLFLRKERGDLALTNIKLQDANLDIKNKFNSIQSKSIMARNTWDTTHQQFNTLEENVAAYQALLAGEQALFENGESSLFLINSREMGYIDAQTKLIITLTKNKIANLETLYALGILNL
ncbi:MAG: TolC family protein [Saprospiraceae bacterium]|nr:TolC family protein [Saprospiraceae bacterium]